MTIPTSGEIKFSDFYVVEPSFDTNLLTSQVNSQYSSWTFRNYTNPFTSGTGHFVIVYNQINYSYTADYQIDYIQLGSTNYSFESNATGWKHVKYVNNLTSFTESDWNGFTWLDIPTGGHIGSSGNNGGWQRQANDSGTSGGTGISNIYNGSYCLYTECSYYSWHTKILRSPLFTFTSSQTISWYDVAYGAGMGNRYMYMVKL